MSSIPSYVLLAEKLHELKTQAAEQPAGSSSAFDDVAKGLSRRVDTVENACKEVKEFASVKSAALEARVDKVEVEQKRAVLLMERNHRDLCARISSIEGTDWLSLL